MIAIIDGDTIPYITSSVAGKNNMTLSQAQKVLDNIFKSILKNCAVDRYVLFVGSSDNFRNDIYPEYKATRQKYKSETQGLYYEELTEYLITKYRAYIVKGAEADDAVSITSARFRSRGIHNIIVSIDKDLLQCEGDHYNYKSKKNSRVKGDGVVKMVKTKNKTTIITTGTYHLWRQMIEGDTIDNIIGLSGYGKVKAYHILKEYDLKEIPDVVLGLYIKEFGFQKGIERFQLNYRLVNIIKESNTMPDVEPVYISSILNEMHEQII